MPLPNRGVLSAAPCIYIYIYIFAVLQRIILNDIFETRFLRELKNNQGSNYTCKDNRGSDSLIPDLPYGRIPSA